MTFHKVRVDKNARKRNFKDQTLFFRDGNKKVHGVWE